jgi:hypothetical protein
MYIFPLPIVKFHFNNEYDVILDSLSASLDRFKREHQLFAAQCIWWPTSIIYYTEILSAYWHCKIFPSSYIWNSTITPLSTHSFSEADVPKNEIPECNWTNNSDPDINTTTHHRNPQGKKFILCQTRELTGITLHSRIIFITKNIKQQALRKLSPTCNEKQWNEIFNHFRKDRLVL